MARIACLAILLTLLGIGCRPSFTAEKAETRILFKVGDDGAAVDPTRLEAVRSIVAGRLQSNSFQSEFIVQTSAPDTLIVLTPKLTDDQLAAVRDMATRPGALEFALLANPTDHAELIAEAEAEQGADAADTAPRWAWVPVSRGPDGRAVDLANEGTLVVRELAHDGVARKEVLVVFEDPDRRVTEAVLEHAAPTTNGVSNAAALLFDLDSKGGYLMQLLTGAAVQRNDGSRRRLGIILDEELHSAPTINDVIHDRGIIEGDFSKEEVDRMVIRFNSGRLPLPVRFIEAQDARAK
jgi:SecD/SecF fusion protein